MSTFKQRLRTWTNQDLIKESKHILNKDPSSYNWTASARQDILDELNKRKTSGKVSMRAGVTKKYKEQMNTSSFGFSIPSFKW